jgi:hypothetical protein
VSRCSGWDYGGVLCPAGDFLGVGLAVVEFGFVGADNQEPAEIYDIHSFGIWLSFRTVAERILLSLIVRYP